MLDTVQSFWSGRLSPLEQLCMKSFVKAGHPFHLYTYDKLEGVPEGVVVKNAEEVVMKSSILRFQNLANFSDFFRFSMLLRNGGWWVDLDVCCLKPFVFPKSYVFATQLVVQRTADEVTSCVIKAPQGCEPLMYCLNKIANTDTKKNSWSAIGPALLVEISRKFNLLSYVKKHETFCPLNYFEAPENVFGEKSNLSVFEEDTFAIHLWNEESRRKNIDKFAAHPGSLYERLLNETA